MRGYDFITLCAGVTAIFLAGCAHTQAAQSPLTSDEPSAAPTAPPVIISPARLSQVDAAARAALKARIASALARPNISFGAIDWHQANMISLLPPAYNPVSGPFQPPNYARPLILRVMTDGRECFLRNEDDTIHITLSESDCTISLSAE